GTNKRIGVVGAGLWSSPSGGESGIRSSGGSRQRMGGTNKRIGVVGAGLWSSPSVGVNLAFAQAEVAVNEWWNE
ncbi:MAG: hypothetical protein ACUVR2_12030, partial [Anaerolineae bacterium]